MENLYEINRGVTAVGIGLNAGPEYVKQLKESVKIQMKIFINEKPCRCYSKHW